MKALIMMNTLPLLPRPFHRTSLANAIALILLGVCVATPAAAQIYDIEISSNQSTTISLLKPGSTVLISPGVTLAPASGNAMTGAIGDIWDITNQGRIQAINGYAFSLNGDGSTIRNSGIINSSDGVWSTGALTFNNKQDALVSVRGVGIGVTIKEGTFILNNAGTITSSDGSAVIANTSNYGELGVSLTNSGLIQGKQGAVSISAGSAGAAAPVSITNLAGGRMLSEGYGVFILHGSSLVSNESGAVISGSTAGVAGSDLYTSLNINNAGSIISMAGAAVRSYGGGVIVNAAGASIEGLGGVVYVRPVVYNTNRLDNSGNIKGTGSVFVTDNTQATTGSGTGVYFGGGLSGTLNQLINRQGATIEGTFFGVYSGYGPRFTDAVGLAIDNSGSISGKTGIAIHAGQGTIVNRGVITGSEGIAIQFDQEGDYDNRLTLDTGSQLHGSVLGGSGNDVLVLNGSGSESLDKFVSFETLAMEGDNWRLTGNASFAAQVDISRGTLQLEGVLTTPVMTLHEAGVLAGAGTLIGNVSNAGLITPGNSNDFATLTIQGNYVGNGGGVLLKTRLAADDSLSDKLVITGDASGNTTLQIINNSGSGALTAANGIQVVQIGGASEATFALQGRVVAGAYEYRLFKNAIDAEDGHWYLRSAKDAVIVVPPATEPPPVIIGGGEDGADTPPHAVKPYAPPAPLLRPEVGAYLGNQIAAQRLFHHSLHDRLGEPQFARRDGEDAGSVWLRVLGGRMQSRAAQGDIDERTDSAVVQVGGDIGAWKNADSRLLVGVMAGYASARTRAGAQDNAANAIGELNGYSLGAYGTWYQGATRQTGPYVDTWLQYVWYDNTVKGNQLSIERYSSNNLSASLESGWAFVLADRSSSQVLIEPQAQAIYSHYTQDDHFEANGTRIHSQRAGQMLTRLGVRLYGRNQTDNGHLWQPFIGINWWHGSGRDRIAFDDVVVQQDVPKNRYEVKAGIQAELAKNWAVWGTVAVQGRQSHYSDINGTLGARYRW